MASDAQKGTRLGVRNKACCRLPYLSRRYLPRGAPPSLESSRGRLHSSPRFTRASLYPSTEPILKGLNTIVFINALKYIGNHQKGERLRATVFRMDTAKLDLLKLAVEDKSSLTVPSYKFRYNEFIILI